MSELTLESVDTMEYHQMKKKLSELGLSPVGTKVELIARLQGYIQGSEAQTPPPSPTPPVMPPVAPPAAQTPPAVTPEDPKVTKAIESGENRKAVKSLKESQKKMKAQLDAEPKVSVMIPFNPGETEQKGRKIPFHVNLNGLPVDYPRGRMIEVPLSHFNIISERLQSEGKIGEHWRIDRDSELPSVDDNLHTAEQKKAALS